MTATQLQENWCLPLTRGWQVQVDHEWYSMLRPLAWQVHIWSRGPECRPFVHAVHHFRRDGRRHCVTMSRVIMGLQDLESGDMLRPGNVGLWTPPDLDTRRIDLRTSNLYVGSMLEIQQRKRKPGRASSRYIGVTWHPRSGRWHASIRYRGHLHWVGAFLTEVEAALARDRFVVTMGLAPYRRLNEPAS
jgi:hypothetical protein